jgi:hypothetical protein
VLKHPVIGFLLAVHLSLFCHNKVIADALPPPQIQPAPSEELNTLLMHATFRISGPSRSPPGATTFGTVFVIGIPSASHPKLAAAVMVTAAHVLDDIATDTATLMARRRNVDGTYTAFPYEFHIRDNQKPRYLEHPTADIAAMYIDLPIEVPITALPPQFLADDRLIEEIDLHPGDEVFCLGFPLAATAPGGFPILRTGHIASYPLTPMKTVGLIDLDLLLFGGNSSGPVYFSYSNRAIKGVTHLGGSMRGILGLVIQNINSGLPGYQGQSLNFGAIVPAVFIRETIDLLPPKP